MSARKQRIEVITRGERRRQWSAEQKRSILAESLEAGVSPIAVARRHGISSGLLYTWRRQLLEGAAGAVCQPTPHFVPVELKTLAPALVVPQPVSVETAVASPLPGGCRPGGLIEIALPDGVSIRVDAQVDPRALRRVLAALAHQ